MDDARSEPTEVRIGVEEKVSFYTYIIEDCRAWEKEARDKLAKRLKDLEDRKKLYFEGDM